MQNFQGLPQIYGLIPRKLHLNKPQVTQMPHVRDHPENCLPTTHTKDVIATRADTFQQLTMN